MLKKQFAIRWRGDRNARAWNICPQFLLFRVVSIKAFIKTPPLPNNNTVAVALLLCAFRLSSPASALRNRCRTPPAIKLPPRLRLRSDAGQTQRSGNGHIRDQCLGDVTTNYSSYTELATGISYLLNGEYVDSVEEVDPVAGGAQATRGRYQGPVGEQRQYFWRSSNK